MPHHKNGSNGKVGAQPDATTRRILLLAAPDTQILDLVGPFQVFTRAKEIAARKDPAAPALYSLEVVTTEPGMLLTSCASASRRSCSLEGAFRAQSLSHSLLCS